MDSEYTFTVAEEQDETSVIRSVKINGTGYKFDPSVMKNMPVYLKKTAGPMMLESEELDFQSTEVSVT